MVGQPEGREWTLDTGGFNRLRRCKHGLFLFNQHDRHVGRALDAYGEWADVEVALLLALVKPGDCVVDVGAHIGTHTIPLARAVSSHGVVHAFEPQRLCFQTLCANLALNSLTSAVAWPAAVGQQGGQIAVPAPDPLVPANFGGTVLGTGKEMVPMMTLDGLDLPRCRLIKIDVEGMESAVLEGSAILLRRAQPIVYVENNDDGRSPALLDQLLGHGYVLHWHISPFYSPHNFYSNAQNVFEPLADINVIAVPPSLAPALRSLLPVLGVGDLPSAALRRQIEAAPR